MELTLTILEAVQWPLLIFCVWSLLVIILLRKADPEVIRAFGDFFRNMKKFF